MAQKIPVPGPFKGIVDNLPRPFSPPNSWDNLENMMPYQGRLITRPALAAFGAPDDGSIVRYIQTYMDVSGNLHTLVLTPNTAYALTAGAVFNELALPSPLTSLEGTGLPYGAAIINGSVYFSNGSCVGLYADGEADIKDSNCVGAWRFAGVLANHLVVCWMTEPEPGEPGSIMFPQRVRWSANGDPTSWDANAFTDLLEVSDEITGYASLGRSGYVIRTNGITMMTPTGVGTAPFQFDQLTNAPIGIGNIYPYAFATYGGVAVMVSGNDIYAFDGTSFSPIGTDAKKKIYADLHDAEGDVVTGWIVPNLSKGFSYLSYWLCIPGPDVAWVYSWDDQSWTRLVQADARISLIANAVTGD